MNDETRVMSKEEVDEVIEIADEYRRSREPWVLPEVTKPLDQKTERRGTP